MSIYEMQVKLAMTTQRMEELRTERQETREAIALAVTTFTPRNAAEKAAHDGLKEVLKK